jgi:hypothetical protein
MWPTAMCDQLVFVSLRSHNGLQSIPLPFLGGGSHSLSQWILLEPSCYSGSPTTHVSPISCTTRYPASHPASHIPHHISRITSHLIHLAPYPASYPAPYPASTCPCAPSTHQGARAPMKHYARLMFERVRTPSLHPRASIETMLAHHMIRGNVSVVRCLEADRTRALRRNSGSNPCPASAGAGYVGTRVRPLINCQGPLACVSRVQPRVVVCQGYVHWSC